MYCCLYAGEGRHKLSLEPVRRQAESFRGGTDKNTQGEGRKMEEEIHEALNSHR